MPVERALTGHLPLMQVSQQQPQDNHLQKRDQTVFRWNPLNFGDSRSHSVLLTHDSDLFAPSTPPEPLQAPRQAYSQIKFFATQTPEQKAAKLAASPDKPARKKRRMMKSVDKPRLKPMKSKSTSSDMHADAWTIILAHTRPAFIMQMRTVSKFFYHITNSDPLWRQARQHYFGDDMPTCPEYLSEKQYGNLLDGRGCQNQRCERRETRKVRWVFRLRLCDDCLSKKLEIYQVETGFSPQSRYASLFQSVAEREQFGTSAVDLLPTSGAWSGKPNSPRHVHPDTGKWISRFNAATPLLHLKSDFAALEADYKEKLGDDAEPEKVLAWTKEWYEWATNVAHTASRIEEWDFMRLHATFAGPTTRGDRRAYFVQKAKQLIPPIEEGILECFAAFQASLSSPNQPSDRAWETLLPKILPYRSQAREVMRYYQQRYTRYIPGSATPESATFDMVHDHRKLNFKDAEQLFVLNLAEAEFEKLVDQVADEDLLLLCLRNTYNAYQQCPSKPQGLNFDGKTGEYRLSLHDAKLIVEEIIEKRIKRSTLRGVKVCEGLRCMGCTRFTSGKRYSFQSAFEHMLDKHARLVGKDLHFHNFLKFYRTPNECMSKDFKFPWYLVEWTRSLPLLPSHAEITAETRWIPDEDVPYIEKTTSTYASAFEGRTAVSNPDIEPCNFVDNFLHAAQTLSTTRLGPESVVKIAIKYATDVNHEGAVPPTLDEFFACIKPTQKLSNSLSFKFRCGACNRRPDVNSHLRCVKHSVDIHVLRKHWDDKHAREGIDWVANFADLPDDSKLTEIMVTLDEKLQHDQQTSMEREIFGLRKSAKKVRDQKVGALMRKEMALSAFGRLFALVDILVADGQAQDETRE